MFRYGFAAFLVLACCLGRRLTRRRPRRTLLSRSTRTSCPSSRRTVRAAIDPGRWRRCRSLTFRDARPWARSMKSKVESRQMPPWFADPAHGEFANDRSLSPRDIETIAKWADSGALEGDPKDAPPPVQWPADGWQIKPDIIVRGPEFRVPAHTPNDVVEWVTFLIPSGFTKDTWITSLEIKPSEFAVTHHICFTFEPHRPNAKYYVANWSESPRDDEGVAIGTAPRHRRRRGPEDPRRPGPRPVEPRPRIPAAASTAGCPGERPTTIVRSVPGSWFRRAATSRSRCTTRRIGKEVVDRPLIGFTVSDTPARKAVDVVRHRRRRTGLRDSAERGELQEPAVRARVRGRRGAGRVHAAHARARQVDDLSSRVSRRS